MSLSVQFDNTLTLEDGVDIFSDLVSMGIAVTLRLVAGHPRIEVL